MAPLVVTLVKMLGAAGLILALPLVTCAGILVLISWLTLGAFMVVCNIE